MQRSITRRAAMRASLGLAMATAGVPAPACEFYAQRFTLIHPWTRASRQGATTAVVCMSFRDINGADRLVGLDTPVAEGAELVGSEAGTALDLVIPDGGLFELTERGLHIRLTGLRHPLEIARAYPLTLNFERSGELRAALNVDYARFA